MINFWIRVALINHTLTKIAKFNTLGYQVRHPFFNFSFKNELAPNEPKILLKCLAYPKHNSSLGPPLSFRLGHRRPFLIVCYKILKNWFYTGVNLRFLNQKFLTKLKNESDTNPKFFDFWLIKSGFSYPSANQLFTLG